MFYLLDGGSNTALTSFASSCSDADTVRFVRDYAKRVLARQSADSDDEADRW